VILRDLERGQLVTDDSECRIFLTRLGEAAQPTGTRIPASMLPDRTYPEHGIC